MNAAPRYATLDGLRGVAAVLVLCYHTHAFQGSAAIAPHGYLAVDFFFMLSGFVIASAYQEKLRAGLPVVDFFRLRMIRLYPVALAGILLGAVKLVSQYAISPAQSEPAQWIALAVFLNALVLPVVSETHFSGALFPTDGPVWSLFYELLVNVGWSISASFKSSIVVILSLTMASGADSVRHHTSSGRRRPRMGIGTPVRRDMQGAVLVSRGHRDLSIPRGVAEFLQRPRHRAAGALGGGVACCARNALVWRGVGRTGDFSVSSRHPDARRALRKRERRGNPLVPGRYLVSGLCGPLSRISLDFRIPARGFPVAECIGGHIDRRSVRACCRDGGEPFRQAAAALRIAQIGLGDPLDVWPKRVINPTGNSVICLSSPAPLRKIFRFAFGANHLHVRRCPVPHRGALRNVTNAERDAVDADGAEDEQRRMRTAKSCGPDAPTLASSRRGVIRAGDGGKQARSPGRARRKP